MSENRPRKKKHTKRKPSSRVKYNPSTKGLDNPEANYDNSLIEKTLEKMIDQLSNLENTVEKLSDEVSRIKKKNKKLSGISGRVTILEADTAEASRKMSGMQYDIESTTYDVHADNHLRDYMMEEKDKDATDTMMSGHEIGSKMEAMKAKRRLHQMQ